MEACGLYDGKSNQLEGSATYFFCGTETLDSVQLSSRLSLHIFQGNIYVLQFHLPVSYKLPHFLR